MRVKVISECGISAALMGLGLSYGKTSGISYHDFKDATYGSFIGGVRTNLHTVALKLAGLGKGHDKFLRMMTLCLDIYAPLYWWKEFDTYKVGTVAQSESTMHTLVNNIFDSGMFEDPISPYTLRTLNKYIKDKNFSALNANLPQSFKQRRIVMTNYATLRNIIEQRTGHKLPQWKVFIDAVLNGCYFPDFLKKEKVNAESNPAH